MENIIENNKIIAEFLNLTSQVIFEQVFAVSENGKTNFYKKDELKFHSDWNWLMKVVEKIENLKPISFLEGRNWQGFEITIYKALNTNINYCIIKYIKEGGYMIISNEFSKESKIEAVCNACIKFIKWYNENR